VQAKLQIKLRTSRLK